MKKREKYTTILSRYLSGFDFSAHKRMMPDESQSSPFTLTNTQLLIRLKQAGRIDLEKKISPWQNAQNGWGCWGRFISDLSFVVPYVFAYLSGRVYAMSRRSRGEECGVM